MSWLFLDWFVPLYLLVSVLVLAGFGACLYFLEPGLQEAHKWSNKTVRDLMRKTPHRELKGIHIMFQNKLCHKSRLRN
uniref:Uncharacterized protein n=1 Tax=Labrus bergylta TaxID=56723 RepID=A0A3Q3G5I6_9LABR